MKKLLAVLAAGFALAAPAFGQATYPTVAGSRVNGVVSLVCDANGQNCAPPGSTGAPATGSPVSDPNNASFTSATGPLVAGTDYSASGFRAVNVTCTAAGSANLTLVGSTAPLPYTFASGPSYQIAFGLKSIDAVPNGCTLYGVK